MKQKLNPVMAIIAVATVILITGIFIWRSGAGTQHANGDKPPGMPPDVAKEFQQRMGGVTGPGASTATTGTPSTGSGGYIMPPTH